MKEDEKIAEKFLIANDWEKQTGFAVNTQEINPDDWDEIYYEGNTLYEALQDFVRETSWWSYKPSNGEQIEEDIWDAVSLVQEEDEKAFENFKKAMKN